MPADPSKPAAKKAAKPKAAAKPKPEAAHSAEKPKPAAAKAAGKAASKTPAKTSAKTAAAKPSASAAKAGAVRLKDLVETVSSATGGKKPDTKHTIEAVLEAMADALRRGDDLILPPLGRMRVVKAAEKDGASTLTLKLRIGGGAGAGPKQPLADDGEDD